MGHFASVNDDILQIILFKLPALSFASAACVSKSWNKVCNRVLCSPKLVSALSVNPSLPDAVTEVLEKVLSGPIRPQFAIASIGLRFNLEAANKLITEKLGSRTPVITTAACGIIGREAVTNKLKLVKWDMIPEVDGSNFQEPDDFNGGIVLTLGFLPGLKVATIPLLRPKREHQVSLLDKFVMDIRNYTASVSGCITAAGIILFGDQQIDMGPVVAEIDCVMPEETVIVGDASSHFMFRSGHNSQDYNADLCFLDAVALVFARDKDKPRGIGETQFHATLSTGVMPFGPKLKTFTVTTMGSEHSWITASVIGYDEILDIQGLLHEVIDDDSADLYIAVIQKKPSSIDPETSKPSAHMAFYKVLERDGVYLVVEGVAINPGDTLLLYRSDADTALSSILDAFKNLKVLKPSSKSTNRYSIKDAVGGDNCGVFGGLIFASHYRGHGGSYFDSFPFCCNFPGVPVAGVVCNKEIGRDAKGSSLQRLQDEEECPARCLLHVCTSVYLVLSYVPPSPNLLID